MSNKITEEQMNEIVKAASNQENTHILQLTTKKIESLKRQILTDLHVSPIALFIQKLKHYRYVDTMNEIKNGAFIRWIDIRDPTATLELSGVAIFCDFQITDRGVSIVYTNFLKRKKYEFLMEEAVIFQKLTHQEEILLHIMNKLN